MHNCFHARLSLPFLFDFVPTEANSSRTLHELDADSLFVKWLTSLNLEVLRGGAEQFYIPPGGEIPIHSDGRTIDNKVKLNFQYGGIGSKMKWYAPVDSETKLLLTSTESYAKKDDVTQVWEAKIGFPSLVNAGTLHNVINGPEPRWVISVPLWDLTTDSRLQWNDAVIKFHPWIVKEHADV